jgi:hypothetical protein
MARTAQNQQRVNIVYLDVNTTYGNTTRAILVANINAINNQLFNLFSSMIGEVDYEPTLGAGPDRSLFDPNDPQSVKKLQMHLYNPVNQWLSTRILVSPNSFIVTQDTLNQRVFITVKYQYLLTGVTVTTTMALPINPSPGSTIGSASAAISTT